MRLRPSIGTVLQLTSPLTIRDAATYNSGNKSIRAANHMGIANHNQDCREASPVSVDTTRDGVLLRLRS
jgi:hypothetical protein